jgi:DNA polymerase-3 subunit delta
VDAHLKPMAKPRSQSLSFDALEASFRKKAFAPLYLFHGEEEFLVEQAVQLLIDQAVDEQERSFNLDVVYGSSIDGKDVVSLVSQFPMMGERRVVIVKEVDRIVNKEVLLPLVEHPIPTTVCAFVSSKPDFRLKFFKSFGQQGTVVEFKRLYENEIPPWIIAQVRKLGKAIDADAAQLMLAYVGRSLREVRNEIDKLFTYVGAKGTIDTNDVNSVVGMSKQFNVFELQKAVGQKRLGSALEIATRMLEAGESALGMVVMLTRYFQKLWLLKELSGKEGAELASLLGVSPFFLRDYLEAARNFSDREIEACFGSLLETDERLKLSADPILMMTLLLHRIIRTHTAAAAGATRAGF